MSKDQKKQHDDSGLQSEYESALENEQKKKQEKPKPTTLRDKLKNLRKQDPFIYE